MNAHSHSRRRLLAAMAVAPIVLSARAHPGAAFPTRSVRIVVPYSVGIGPDVVARAVGESLTKTWRQAVVIDNRPGASGIVAFAEVRHTVPDGHTLFVGDTGSLAVNPLIHASLPYDRDRDLVPITKLFHATLAIQVGGQSRFRTMAELLAEARRTPGNVSYASLGNGHPTHVAVESMARAAKVELLHVPFRDGGTLMTAVANGDVDFTPLSMYTVAGLAKGGKMRALAVCKRTRLSEYPHLPTLAETGGPPVEMRPWAALVGVSGTPPMVIEKLQRDVIAALQAPEVRARFESSGFEVAPSTPAELRAQIAADAIEYGVLVREGRVQRV